MQSQHLIVIALLVPLSWALLAYFIWRAITRQERRRHQAHATAVATLHDKRIHAMHEDIAHLNRLRRDERVNHLEVRQQIERHVTELQHQAMLIKSAPFTLRDYKVLVEAAQMINLAARTWAAMPSVALTIRQTAGELERQIGNVALQIKATIESTNALTGDTLDTRLIDWLDTRATFDATQECGILTFPVAVDIQGYGTFRELLRDAMQQQEIMEASNDSAAQLGGAA